MIDALISQVGRDRIAKFSVYVLLMCLAIALDIAWLNATNAISSSKLEYCSYQERFGNWRPYVDHVEVFKCDDGSTRFLYVDSGLSNWAK